MFSWKNIPLFLSPLTTLDWFLFFLWNCSFTWFYAKKALFFPASFSETLTVSNSFRSFFWNWSETATSFNQIIQNRITSSETYFFDRNWVSKNWFFSVLDEKNWSVPKKYFLSQKSLPFKKNAGNFWVLKLLKSNFWHASNSA